MSKKGFFGAMPRIAMMTLFVGVMLVLGGGQAFADIETYSKKKDGEKQLSKDFKVKEFACPDCDVIKIDTELVKRLQQIRTKYGVPVNIQRGYTCENQANKLGLASNSQHRLGKAAIIEVKGYFHKDGPVTYLDIRNYAFSIGLSYAKKMCELYVDTRDISYARVLDFGTNAKCKLNPGSDSCKYNHL